MDQITIIWNGEGYKAAAEHVDGKMIMELRTDGAEDGLLGVGDCYLHANMLYEVEEAKHEDKILRTVAATWKGRRDDTATPQKSKRTKKSKDAAHE